MNLSEKNIKIEKYSENLTPSRLICNHFWETINWPLINKFLNNRINILDIGCGTGLWIIFRQNDSNGFNSYLGIMEVKKEWDNLSKDKRYKFLDIDASKIENYYNEPNIIISQSALEHFGFDEDLLNKINQISINNKKPLIQIHLVPSFPCLFTYLYGYRQYSPRTISKLIKTNQH